MNMLPVVSKLEPFYRYGDISGPEPFHFNIEGLLVYFIEMPTTEEVCISIRNSG